MSEHQLLKEICDKIWYLVIYAYDDWYYEAIWKIDYRYINVREIIFTQEFENKMREYSYNEWDFIWEAVWMDLINHLNNPVEYLADILEITNK